MKEKILPAAAIGLSAFIIIEAPQTAAAIVKDGGELLYGLAHGASVFLSDLTHTNSHQGSLENPTTHIVFTQGATTVMASGTPFNTQRRDMRS